MKTKLRRRDLYVNRDGCICVLAGNDTIENHGLESSHSSTRRLYMKPERDVDTERKRRGLVTSEQNEALHTPEAGNRIPGEGFFVEYDCVR